MNNFFLLTKLFFKNTSYSMNKKNIALSILLVICFLPLIGLFALGTIASYDSLYKYNIQGLMLSSTFSMTCMIIIFLGFFYIMSSFYFSSDTESLVCLPIRPYELLSAKLFTIIIAQYFTEIVILLPILGAFCYKNGSILFIIYSIIIFFTLPIIPTVICSLIIILIMSFSKFMHNKDRFKNIAGIIGITLAILFQIANSKFNSSSKSGNPLISTLKDNGNLFNNFSNVFGFSKFAAYSLVYSNKRLGFLYLLIFLLISIAVFLIFIFAAQNLYLKGVLAISNVSSSNKKLSKNELSKLSIKNSVLKSYTLKEFKLLLRTPAYLQNCILGGIIFPIFMLFFFGFNKKNGSNLFFNLPMNGRFFAVSAAVLVALGSFNMICSTSISREGSSFYFMKYIPVPFELQILSKVLSGALISILTSVLILVIGIFVFKITPLMIILLLVTSIIGAVSYSFWGVFLDITFPKLDWDNEAKAVKQNLNPIIITVLTSIILTVPTIIICILNINLATSFIIFTFIILVFSTLGIKFAIQNGSKKLGGEYYNSNFWELGKLKSK